MKRVLLTSFAVLLGSPCALAATPVEPVQKFVERDAIAAARAVAGPQARVEVSVTPVEPRFARGLCSRVEPSSPPGSHSWGRTHVNVRCIEGADWSVQWPVSIRIYAPALVATRPLQAMEAITPTDLREAEVEWTRAPQGFVTGLEQLDERVVQRPVPAGQPIGLDQLRAQMEIGIGDTVKLVASGDGFSIAADGQAMNAAADGQQVRVRTESGKVLSGTARPNRVVEVVF